MSDVARYLPLSQRPPEDESGVSSNWSVYVDESLGALAALLEASEPTVLDLPAQQDGWQVRDTVGHLLFVLGSGRTARMRELVRTSLANRIRPAGALAVLSRQSGGGSRDEMVQKLRAAQAGTPGASAAPKRRISELSAAVVDAYDIAVSVSAALSLSSTASGAVALARSTTAPLPLRAGIRERTLVATDASWRIGTGAELPGTASQLVLFLWGRAGMPQSPREGETPPPASAEDSLDR